MYFCCHLQLLPWLLRFMPDGPAHELEDLLAHLGADNIKVQLPSHLHS